MLTSRRACERAPTGVSPRQRDTPQDEGEHPVSGMSRPAAQPPAALSKQAMGTVRRAGVLEGRGAATRGERPRDTPSRKGGSTMAKKTAKGGKKKATKKR